MKKVELNKVISSILTLFIVLVLVGGGIMAIRAISQKGTSNTIQTDADAIWLNKVYAEKNLTTMDYDIPLTEDAKHFRIEVSAHFYNDSAFHQLGVSTSEVFGKYFRFEKIDGTSYHFNDTAKVFPLTDNSPGEKYCKIVIEYNVEQFNNSLDVQVFIDNLTKADSNVVYIKGTLISKIANMLVLNINGKISDYCDGQVVVYQWL
jgi:hypothetical protein